MLARSVNSARFFFFQPLGDSRPFGAWSSTNLEHLVNFTANKNLMLDMNTVRPYIATAQYRAMVELAQGAERAHYAEAFTTLAERIRAMPHTYQQSGVGRNSIAHLHYFLGNSHWYITEKDKFGGVRQAFCFAILQGDWMNAEFGYVSIAELTRIGAEVDLTFKPQRLAEVIAMGD